MADFKPRRIIGKWRNGFALDLQTLRSEFVGYDEYGHARFDTERSEIGELLYRLKYRSDRGVIAEIASGAAEFVRTWNPGADVLVSVPPSTQRAVQPVPILATAIAARLGMPYQDCVSRTRDVPELKNVSDLDERLALLEGLHAVEESATRDKRILLFDDLYRSGATMNAVTAALYESGDAREVFALTITRTRSHR